MAANFWTSSHSKQLLDADDVARIHPDNLALGLTAEEISALKSHLTHNIKVLAQQAKVRQRVVATATVYFRRVCAKCSFREYDLRLVAPTCLYLASKSEESTVQAKLLVFYMNKLWPTAGYGVGDILEMEMHLLEALDYHLIIFHPYRPLIQYLADIGGAADLVPTCWSLVNDSLSTDLCLVHAPHVIALGCLHLACALRGHDAGLRWFEDLRVDLGAIRSVSLEMLDFYESHKASESMAPRALAKLPPRQP